jgi:ADP-ribose pyrophosphatase
VKGEERVLAKTPILELRGVTYRYPGRTAGKEFSVIASSDWVNVIAITPEKRIVLVRQFRFGIDGLSLEIPGGIIEPGEDPVAAGVRELAEETGYVGQQGVLLGSVRPNPAIQNNRCHLVLVEGAERSGAQAWDQDEEIEVLTASVDQALTWARTGLITHALVLCGLFHYDQWRRQLRPLLEP